MTGTEMVSLISPDTVIKVSSTLDKSVGKKNLVDGSPETCWTSQQGLPQTITLILPSSSPCGVIPKLLSITFQGGFVGRTCAIHARANWRLLTYIYPEDVNRKQTFTLPSLSDAALTFETSSDFFGRVTVYDLDLKGYLA
ncbi:MAG: hypothetical protein NXY57DRAFT_1047629 [Lentinula lateritia]|nr:MAG: hypothetical protein NXY57DRAFT_1047629 [Lentinula lateritia]